MKFVSVCNSELRHLIKTKGRQYSIHAPTNEKVAYLNLLCKMFSEGKLKIIIDRIYSFQQIVEAHKYVDLGHKKGNVVIGHISFSISEQVCHCSKVEQQSV